MDRPKQAEFAAKLGASILAGAVAGEVAAAVYKGDVPVIALHILVVIGASLTLFGMIYGRIVDTVECFLCDATVPRFNTKQDSSGYWCEVCQGTRFEYPYGSSNLPIKKTCGTCNRKFYRFLIAAKPDGSEWICRWCIVTGRVMAKELLDYAKAKGTTLTPALAERWVAEQVAKNPTETKPNPVGWHDWIPFGLTVAAIILGIIWITK